MNDPITSTSPRGMTWARRKQALARIWRELRHDRAGFVSLLVLLGFGLVALSAPLIADRSLLLAAAGRNNPDLASPRAQFLLGTDDIGRDVLAQLVWGSRVSLFIGIFATVVAVVIGSVVGLVAGYVKGKVATVLLAIDEFFLVVPFLPLAIVLAVILGRSPVTLAIVIGITSWAGSARLVRAQVLTLSERAYVERARALGAGTWQIIFRHVLPGVTPLIIANATLIVPGAILTESTLSFLGFGDRLSPSWGKLLDGAQSSGSITLNAWWYYLPPGLCIITVVLAFTLFGRALERIFDPRLAGR
jgi:peptide/nickel transport system permease protein